MNGHVGAETANCGYSARQLPAGAGDATNLIVYVRRPIDRHDNVVNGIDDRRGVPFERQAGRQQSEMYSFRTQQSRQRCEV